MSNRLSEGANCSLNASPRRLLVVDDEPTICALVSEVLMAAGYQVETARDSQRALACLAQNHYDAVLLDVRLPGVSESTLYNWITTSRPELVPRLGFITGDTLSTATQTFLAATRRPVLTKPFTLQELCSFVQRLVSP
ncbi:MAG: response regulator [Deinococcus sp.]|nr:response regulator [Deinococcus sp.]